MTTTRKPETPTPTNTNPEQLPIPAAQIAPDTPASTAPAPTAPTSYFADVDSFERGQRVARLLASSDLVPKQYRDNIANTLLALEIARQTGSSPFFVMQNLYIIQGRPSWSAQFIAAVLNACGRFPGRLAL